MWYNSDRIVKLKKEDYEMYEKARCLDNIYALAKERGIKIGDLEEKIGSVTLIGLCTDICVISNALLIKAFLPEVPITVDPRCCAGVTPKSHNNALEAMKMCQIRIA